MSGANTHQTPAMSIEARSVSKYFGRVIALEDINFRVESGEVVCLLGDNGAGKSTLIKILSGFYQPDEGAVYINGEAVQLNSPRDAIARGIGTVYQDFGVLPMLSVARNFVLGSEPLVGWGPFRRFNRREAEKIAQAKMFEIGIELRTTSQLGGTLSGGEQQTLAIARAEYYGAKVLILDEPTSALGVKEAATVLRHIIRARKRQLGVVLITHNVQHALPVGDRFVILRHGRMVETFRHGDLDERMLMGHMGGGAELDELREELAAMRDT